MDHPPACRLARYPQDIPVSLRGGVITLGNFDGVHLGHEHVIRSVHEAAGTDSCTVVSFYPHPLQVLRRADDVRYITSLREKREHLGQLGIDLLYLVHFTPQMAQMTARTFIENVFVKALGARVLVVGEDAALGRGREGDIPFLQANLPKYGISLQVVPKFDTSVGKPSSRAIRALIVQGDVKGANALLGRPFCISARVGHGDKRGGAIGFPTMNIAAGRRLLPARGVYACRATIDGVEHPAVANIGTRPTFNGLGERLEVHVLDHNPGPMYGRRVEVAFVERLRDERRFASVEELKEQIARDVVQARAILVESVR
jgi:riboflavin kinase/FMN adenylyltransferase